MNVRHGGFCIRLFLPLLYASNERNVGAHYGVFSAMRVCKYAAVASCSTSSFHLNEINGICVEHSPADGVVW